MTEPVHAGDYRACPFCCELIRVDAIKCRHCASEIDPNKMGPGGPGARTNAWHLTVLGVLLLVTAFVAAYPAIVKHMDERALNKAMIQRATTIPEAPRPVEVVAIPPQETVIDSSDVVPGLSTLNFGEDAEIVVGKTYSGSAIADLFENAYQTRYHLDSEITVDFAGVSYQVRARQARFAPEGRYKILSIEEKGKTYR